MKLLGSIRHWIEKKYHLNFFAATYFSLKREILIALLKTIYLQRSTLVQQKIVVLALSESYKQSSILTKKIKYKYA